MGIYFYLLVATLISYTLYCRELIELNMENIEHKVNKLVFKMIVGIAVILSVSFNLSFGLVETLEQSNNASITKIQQTGSVIQRNSYTKD